MAYCGPAAEPPGWAGHRLIRPPGRLHQRTPHFKPDDLSATLYEALGIPHDTRLADIGGRPHAISEGTPIRELLG